MRRLFPIFAVVMCLSMLSAAENRVSTKLIADASAIARGDAFRVGVLFKIPEHAHIYWANPGDSGLPTSIEWSAPDLFRVEALEWPNPVAFDDEVLHETSFGYQTEVLLFSTVRAPYPIQPGQSVTIDANATWLVCLDDGQCIPENAALELTLPVQEESQASSDAPIFDAYASQTPGTIRESGLPAKITVSGQPHPSVKISLSESWRVNLAGSAPRFFPDRGGNWPMTDDSEGEQDAPEITFIPAGKVDGYTSGVVTLPAVNADTGETRTAYLRFGAPPKRD